MCCLRCALAIQGTGVILAVVARIRVSFENNRLFSGALRPLPDSCGRGAPLKAGAQPTPRFLVVRDKAFAGWWGSLRAVCRPARSRLYTVPARLFRNTPVARFRFAGRPLLLSVLLHIAGFLWYPYLPAWNFSGRAPSEVTSAEPAKIYYRVNLADFVQKVPRLRLAGTGGRPGTGSVPEQPPALGSTVVHPKLTIVLRPPKTDNRKQTIHQNQSAPDLRITVDLKVPNLLAGTVAPARPKVYFSPNSAKPIQAKSRVTTAPAPELAASTSHSVIPVLPMASGQPHLPVPPSAPPPADPGNDAVIFADGALLSGKDPNALVVVSVDPVPGASSLALPPGSRWAELSVSPAGGGEGSPGGIRGGAPNGGHGGAGTGDTSGGLGRERSGGGGGETANAVGILSANGTGDVSKGVPVLADPMLPANMVYALPSVGRLRKEGLVVSAGPIGGGGLNAYGALHCGKIYTVFLQMPGKSWTLQFCESKHDAGPNGTQGRSTIVRLEPGLLPPDAETRFDFRRLPLPTESAHKLILLRGLILEDGTVAQVQVYRSLLPPMDEAARLAFSRWKFRPALREGRPVSIEFLVGIPSIAGANPQNP